MITAYDKFHSAIIEMRKSTDVAKFCTDEATRKDYLCIRKYLNVHELIAVGISKKVLDCDVCYGFWGDTLMNNYADAKPVLEFLASRPKNKYTYADLHKLNVEWVRRKNNAK